jgi:hypothetical protein
MNRHERRAAAAQAAHDAGHIQQECRCGWLAPRETFVELAHGTPPPARIVIVVLCPVCSARFDVEVGLSPEA